MNSATVLIGTSWFTSITLVSFMVPPTGTLSRMKSNGRLCVERCADEVVRADEADGVAVGRRGQVGLGADIAAGADAVLDDELLAEMFRQVLAEQPRGGVVGAAGRERRR